MGGGGGGEGKEEGGMTCGSAVGSWDKGEI
jgi:hypothetical protein